MAPKCVDPSRTTKRVAVSGVGAAVVVAVVWLLAPRGLRPPLDIVGYATFNDFDFQPMFRAYRLVVWVLPALVLAGYLALARWGPLAAPRVPRHPVALLDARDVPEVRGRIVTRPGRRVWSVPALADDLDGPVPAALRATRLAPTLAVVVIAAGSGSVSGGESWLTTAGVLAGLAVAVVVTAGAAALTAWSGARSELPPWRRWGRAWSVVHAGVAAITTICAVTWFARRTVVVMADGGSTRYSWVPLWLAALALVATAGLLVVGIRAWSPNRVEAAVVRVLVGAAFVYLATSHLYGGVGPIQGFDDMQSVTGADLLSRGFFPWKDFLFVHGLFEDALRSSVGFLLFGHTMWGTMAALGLIWIPLTWTSCYLLAVWAARDGSVALVVVALLLVWGSAQRDPSPRWVASPLVFVLLGEAVRRARPLWTALLTTVLFVEAVLVPEAFFQVVAVVVVLVASDLAHRPEGRSRRRSLVRTGQFVLVSVVLTALLAVFLAAKGALRAFVDYYLVFGPGHVASGTYPLTLASTTADWVCFVASVALAAGTLWWVGVRMVSRRPMSSRQWVALGCAVLVGLYGEKALGRFEVYHVMQVVTVTVPLALLWLVLALARLDELGRATLARRRETCRASGPGHSRRAGLSHRPVTGGRAAASAVRQPVSLLALAVLVVGLPSVSQDLAHAAGNNTTSVDGQRLPKLGYTVPGAVDTTLLRDLRSVIDTYAPDGSVFDMTNAPGYFYYLLGEDPPTSYYHISMAITEYSQERVIDELEDRRPELAVVQGPFGLPGWDGPHNIIRHFAVSQYLLDHYTPVLRVHDSLFLARNDLVPSLPAPPDLAVRPQQDQLWFAMPPCDFGATANFLDSEPQGEMVDLAVDAPRATRRVMYGGWAYDAAAGRPVRKVLLVAGGDVVDSSPASLSRPDVAAWLDDPAARLSGFSTGIDTRRRGALSVYAVLSDGLAHPVGRPPRVSPAVLNRPGRSPVGVSPEPAIGSRETLASQNVRVSEVKVPRGTRLGDYSLLTVGSSMGALGTAYFELSDSRRVPQARDRRIVWTSLPVAGDEMQVRVGSCLQWHGYQGPTLYLTQHGGRTVDHLAVSDVS